MRCATTEECEVADVQLESVLLAQGRRYGFEHLRGNVDHDSARFADEMLVRDTDVVHGGAVTDVGVIDDAESLERIQRAIHGRKMYLGMALVDRRREILRGDV